MTFKNIFLSKRSKEHNSILNTQIDRSATLQYSCQLRYALPFWYIINNIVLIFFPTMSFICEFTPYRIPTTNLLLII